MAVKLRVVCATREKKEDFCAKTALGRSLVLWRPPAVELVLFDRNTKGLPELYNQAIAAAASDPAILMFVHDDVHLFDFFWPYHILTGLRTFDIIGLAGNKRRVPNQPAWAFTDDKFTWDTPDNLSGTVGHGSGFPPSNVSVYGAPGQQVRLLDGVLLAVRSETLLSQDLRFDERFAFHFYDMDFCRQAEVKGLRLGTWMISVIYESGGQFGSPVWQAAYARYLDKWGS